MKKLRTQVIRIGICIGKAFLNVIYFFVKMCPTKNKVVMLSRQSNKTSIDFELIEKEILNRTNDVEVKILCKILKKDIRERINYCFYILKCMYHIATSRVCILDGYSIPISILNHKKDLEIIQIWHASGAIKKFGYQSLNKKEGRGTDIARIMNMHKNYNHVMAPSKVTAGFYEEAFDVETDKIFINGLPRLDYILDENLTKSKIKQFYKEYPRFKDENKKNILYVPTFRKNSENINGIEHLKDSINKSKYNLIIKAHPLDKNKIEDEYLVSKRYNTYDLLKIADYVITDYSAVAFEACILNKPLYFYVYDIHEYEKARGLNVDLYQEMNSSTSIDIKEILHSIEDDKYNYEELEKFRNKYMGNTTNNNAEKLVDFVFKYLDKDVENEKTKNNTDEYSKKELNV